MDAAKDTVGVRELRQNLSVYLDRVKNGETLTVTEHRQAVAVLGPAGVPRFYVLHSFTWLRIRTSR
jgi:prevent-host-death family protein